MPAHESSHPEDRYETPITRRAAVTGLSALAGVAAMGGVLGTGAVANAAVLKGDELGFDQEAGTYSLPKLSYAYDALEPVIDEQTMRIHHTRHHQGYVNGLNKALVALVAIRDGSGDGSLMKHWSREVAFHGSGHVNHSMFWSNMTPQDDGGGVMPEGPLLRLLDRDFGNFQRFKGHLLSASKSVEGSGWGWLVWEPMAGRLLVTQCEKQQNMMMTGVIPLLGIDVWEHAYYLKYQNRRAEYISNWFNIVNWKRVTERLEAAMG